MSDAPTDRLAAANRVSIRAVLVRQGEDASAALAKASIIDAVAIPVVVGDDVDLPGGIFGDGRTPNLTALLETEREDEFEDQAGTEPGPARSTGEADPPSEPVTTMLPAAFGMRPLAPVRRFGENVAKEAQAVLRKLNPILPAEAADLKG
ncbi:MAG: hypothetical protein ABSC06_21060 [Rhodopila sp.]|jgi:hypothetical protein